MTHGLAGATDRLNGEREQALSRCKLAPAHNIASHKEALEAWQKYVDYTSRAHAAYASYQKANSGSVRAHKAYAKYLAFSDAAESWHDRLDRHMRSMAAR